MWPLASMVCAVFLSASSLLCSKVGAVEVGAHAFIFFRFFLGAVAMGVIALWWRASVGRGELWRGAGLAVVLFATLYFSILGLRTVTVSLSAFISGLSVVFVFIYGLARQRRWPSFYDGAMVGLALGGLGLITLGEPVVVGWDGAYTIVSTLCWAIYIGLLGRWSAAVDPVGMNFIQTVVVAVLAFVVSCVLGAPLALPREGVTWWAVGVGAIGGSCLVFTIQALVQPKLGDLKVSMLYLLRPVFCALFDYLWLGEVLGPRFLMGAGLILLALCGLNLRVGRR